MYSRRGSRASPPIGVFHALFLNTFAARRTFSLSEHRCVGILETTIKGAAPKGDAANRASLSPTGRPARTSMCPLLSGPRSARQPRSAKPEIRSIIPIPQRFRHSATYQHGLRIEPTLKAAHPRRGPQQVSFIMAGAPSGEGRH